MFLQEPTIVFMTIDFMISTENNSGTGGGEYCIGTGEPTTYCPNNNNDTDWSNPCSSAEASWVYGKRKNGEGSSSSKQSVAPKSIVGFDMHFDK